MQRPSVPAAAPEKEPVEKAAPKKPEEPKKKTESAEKIKTEEPEVKSAPAFDELGGKFTFFGPLTLFQVVTT